ncbi:prepilin-type N-terminal cleavage/methylation domain-containing protein [Poriferisphaera sp. WC338]|uniref:prepilin-type N-terminal cleavage/methylation domain-containing protein n=1 Tax=Poriferisphaera sp. WC338 TaxID=3425129 RepID=UPI003D81B160
MNDRAGQHGGMARGFTLIEVLAALLLVSLVLPIAMGGISFAMRRTGDAQKQAVAARLAKYQMNLLQLETVAGTTGLAGDFEDLGYVDYTWEADYSEWIDTAVWRLEVVVTYPDRDDVQQYALDTLVYSGGGE